MFVVIDEESFQTLQNAPLPEDLLQRLEDGQRYYVKVVEALEDDAEPPLKCSLRSMFIVWLDMQEGAYLEESCSLRPYGTDVF
ncbi:uncharacterized protein N7479_002444 [Penicillium vulpinum]|uniref:uncharacterized protein n=1 Tax=Penicillium vulpinum TaxID=29845 RepID=UPI002547E766|nr:uncharacterized protein N7479_002444 [Penicillium vulpinum]KAJ5972526.1 hypothetical protein N7479_002444 [Penicillium vulpinum]